VARNAKMPVFENDTAVFRQGRAASLALALVLAGFGGQRVQPEVLGGQIVALAVEVGNGSADNIRIRSDGAAVLPVEINLASRAIQFGGEFG